MIKRLTLGLSLMMICVISACDDAKSREKMPYDHWRLHITHPKHFRITMVYVSAIDRDGKYTEPMGFAVSRDSRSIDKWDQFPAVSGDWMPNDLPRIIPICWDSWIDKSSYYAEITLTDEMRALMREPLTYTNPITGDQEHNRYRKVVQLGLAPRGNVSVWITGAGEPVSPLVLRTKGIKNGCTSHFTDWEQPGIIEEEDQAWIDENGIPDEW